MSCHWAKPRVPERGSNAVLSHRPTLQGWPYKRRMVTMAALKPPERTLAMRLQGRAHSGGRNTKFPNLLLLNLGALLHSCRCNLDGCSGLCVLPPPPEKSLSVQLVLTEAPDPASVVPRSCFCCPLPLVGATFAQNDSTVYMATPSRSAGSIGCR